MPEFTAKQRAAIKKLAAGVAAVAIAASMAVVNARIQAVEDRVSALEAPASPSPSPSPSSEPSPSESASPSPTGSPTPTSSPEPPSPTSSPSTSPTPSPTPSSGPVPLPGPEPVGPGGGVFSVVCNYDHTAKDDPIVNPGAPGGAAHLHDFFGEEGIDSSVTTQDLGRGETTCEHQADHAGYWVPALVAPNGTVVTPRNIIAYYQSGHAVRALPPGLVMIADLGGDPDTGFGCFNNTDIQPSPDLTCDTGSVRMHVHFPRFWDGVHLDSPDHRSHMSFTRDAAHPIELVGLHIHVFYGLKSTVGYHLALNTNGTTPVVHADFMNGWLPGVLENIVRDCVNAGRDCKTNTTAGLP